MEELTFVHVMKLYLEFGFVWHPETLQYRPTSTFFNFVFPCIIV